MTKELNDLHLYSVAKNEWVTVHDSANSPLRSPKKGSMNKRGESPTSPIRSGPDTSIESPNKLMNRSMTKQMRSTNLTKPKTSSNKKRNQGQPLRNMNVLAQL